jgi:acetylornithine deacetylase/succinyl-diaminopimelate desuccinylase-like protein
MSETTSLPSYSLERILGWMDARRDLWLEELKSFLRIPSISAQPHMKGEVKAAAEWLEAQMSAAGLENVKLIETGRHPLLYADWLNAGPDAPTVLIYGHYDVQPPEPLELWESPPFEPTLKGDYLYARGVADDKGQLYIHVKAAEAYLQSVGRLPVNLKFIVEGEEEVGGASLAAFVPANKEVLAADAVLISDSHILGPDQPAIVYGLRGTCYVFLDVTGPRRDLHSGSFGGGIDNPINVMAQIIARLKDLEGHVLIPGFYDRVVPLEADERQRIAGGLGDDRAWLEQTGAPEAWGEPEYNLAERVCARPTLDVNGIIGGYTGEGSKTVLPSTVHAKISMRLVPDQEPREIFAKFRAYVESIAPPTVTVEATYVHGAEPVLMPLDSPGMKAGQWAYEGTFGRAPEFVREGGSIPVVAAFQQELGLEVVMLGFGLADDQIHAPNERFYLPNFYRGVETSIRFLARYAALKSDAAEQSVPD